MIIPRQHPKKFAVLKLDGVKHNDKSFLKNW